MLRTLPLTVLISLLLADVAAAQYPGWQHSGSFYVLTTPQGADIPATASEEGFPLLVRLNREWFDFGQAKANGDDIRFSDNSGAPVAYEIDEWDATGGTASIWVRIPVMKGNDKQELKMYWGKPDAVGESNGSAVFNASNGFLSVWHMSDPVKDDIGTLVSKDIDTTDTRGVVGHARHFAGKQGIFCGDKITSYPTGAASHSTEAWFKCERPNSTILGWGVEGGNGGKVLPMFRSPPHMHIESDFRDVDGATRLPLSQWIHVAHTYDGADSRVYINGKLDGVSRVRFNVKSPCRMWIGGWYDNYSFVGDIDEVRVSKVARSADWIAMEYANQKPLQTLVGPLVQPGNEFSVSTPAIKVDEGKSITVTAMAGGAQKVYWLLKRDLLNLDSAAKVVAVDQYSYTLDAGRVSGDQSLTLQFKAVYPNEVKTLDIPVTIHEDIPDPVFTLQAPEKWNGRETIEVVPQISNTNAMQAKGAGQLKYDWTVSGMAVIREIAPDRLFLKRSQNSGKLIVTATISNGGSPITQTTEITVKEPERDAWVDRVPDKDEKPQDNEFYPRGADDSGALYCNGTLKESADSVVLKVYADDKLVQTLKQKPKADGSYSFAASLKAGLIKYRVELGTKVGDVETIIHKAGNIVCGDAFIIDGQSNALATDTGQESPRETNEWIRSHAFKGNYDKDSPTSLWVNPVWKGNDEHRTELGWWGMELAKRLVETNQVPVFIINGAVGGTRIDQHQRNAADPEDPETIYGRMLWRVRQARMTHGIRAILWHQGENDQGSDGPGGGYGWETYRQYFLEMSAAWKQDFPNVQHYYIFQIWPNSCSMGGGHGDMLREVQRTLPSLYSNMDIMPTLGVRPPGSCHFPLAGWSQFATLIQPLIERDIYGVKPTASITAPNLKRAYYTSKAKDAITLEFDQPVEWTDALIGEFYTDGVRGKIASGSASGNSVTLKLTEASTAKTISYLKETAWSQDRLLVGKNGIAALTFCHVDLEPAKP